MADDELQAIRQQRMAEHQARHGVRTSNGATLRPPYKDMLSSVCCQLLQLNQTQELHQTHKQVVSMLTLKPKYGLWSFKLCGIHYNSLKRHWLCQNLVDLALTAHTPLIKTMLAQHGEHRVFTCADVYSKLLYIFKLLDYFGQRQTSVLSILCCMFAVRTVQWLYTSVALHIQ